MADKPDTKKDHSPSTVNAQDNSIAIGSVAVTGDGDKNIVVGNNNQVIVNNYIAQPALVDQSKLDEAEIRIQYFEPETIYIPAGAFWMGRNAGEGIPGYETPRHEVKLAAYRIGKYPVTNAQYEEFIRATNRSVAPEMEWDGQKVPSGMERLPVTGVTWYDAQSYCEWLSTKTGRRYVIPNEAQWEKACCGGHEHIYPWGDEFDAGRCNHGRAQLAAVDAYPAQNEFGCYDWVGNIRQWTCTLWGEKRVAPDPKYAYPWQDDGRNHLNASRQIRRVVRGSSLKDDLKLMRCSARRGETPDTFGLPGFRHGFRVVMSV